MEARLNLIKAAPKSWNAMLALQDTVNKCGLEQTILELVKLRASQLNGCAFCIAMHTRDALKHGISQERMHLLNAWREAPLYSAREQAALAWTEALTFITQGHAADAVYEQVRQQFSAEETASLSFAIAAINTWNRLAISARIPPQVEAA
ncbi:carboxymuconolactone decarboxylase family protein [Nevskia soli]|uniref:carboxymuconolactone decarboxylase family protein n=1 Tax=Nevskia soli TaxID=418856 RepID=UPI0004A6BC01|nr:carboxymuconolactone decarboxylase family protein [Nevskia soli]